MLNEQRLLPAIGIITALPKEFAAVKAILERPQEDSIAGKGSGRRYLLGEIPAQRGGAHYVVLSLAEKGNNRAAIGATLLLEHFPNVDSILMVGIAGGVPHPHKAAEHVRLGDIVVSDARGVVQYDFVKEEVTETRDHHLPRPPSAALLEAVGLLEVAEIEGSYPWAEHIHHLQRKLNIQRPDPETDILFSSADPPQPLPHPEDSRRSRNAVLRVFKGPIASANTLLKNPLKRDLLRDTFGVKAVEREGSGVADATWNHQVGYLVVRGICDYCDSNENDTWQAYATIVAAAYTRALIASMPVQPSPANQKLQLLIQKQLARLADEDDAIRTEAAQIFVALKDRSTVPSLSRHLWTEPDPTVRYWLAYALGQIGGQEACTALREAISREKDPFALRGITEGLQKAGC